MERITVFLLAFSIAVLGGPAFAGPIADYGDAPDPGFPSLYASGGPYHLDVTQEWIGHETPSATTAEIDSRQVDSDESDHGGWVFQVTDAGEVTTWFATCVSYDPNLSAPDEPRYLNVLIDIDGDGTWEGGDEWAVQNRPIAFDHLPPGVSTMVAVTMIPNSIIPAQVVSHYARATLSDQEVADGSGAWGEFARGETEDFALRGDPPPEKLVDFRGGGFKFVPRTPTEGCPHGHSGELTGVCPAHTWTHTAKLFVRGGTVWFSVRLLSLGGCGRCADVCPGTCISWNNGANLWSVLFPPVRPPGAFLGWSPNVCGTLNLGQNNEFRLITGLAGAPGHDELLCQYWYCYDPEGEHVDVIAWTRAESDETVFVVAPISPVTIEQLTKLDLIPYSTPITWSSAGGRKITTTPDGTLSPAGPYGFFVEQEDRTHGVRVQSTEPLTAAKGQETALFGVYWQDENGNPYVDVSPPGHVMFADGKILGPLGMPNRAVGGSMVTGGAGLPNVGLYATTWGLVIDEPFFDIDYNVWYMIDDGSGARVLCCDLHSDGYLPAASMGQFVTVTGPIQMIKEGEQYRRLIVATDQTVYSPP